MEKAIKLTSETMAKGTTLKLNKNRLGFKDVEDMTQCLMQKQKSSDKARDAKYEIVKDFMKHKYSDAVKCIKSTKRELAISKDNLSKVVRGGTLVRKEFMETVDKEVRIVF